MFPKLTDVGDTATLTITSCVPQTTPKGEAVVFSFEGHDDTLMLPRLGVDGALMRLGFYDKPTRGEDGDGIVRYDDVKGERLVFSRTAPKRGTTPGWFIDKPKPEAPPVAAEAPPAPERPAPHRSVSDQLDAGADALDWAEAKRDVIRAAYLRELDFVLGDPAKRAKKAKLPLDLNAAVATLLIAMDRRGCL